MTIKTTIQEQISQGLAELFDFAIQPSDIVVNQTRKDQAGDFTVVLFPLARPLRMAPPKIGAALAAYLEGKLEHVEAIEAVQGFLNLSLSDSFWKQFLQTILQNREYGRFPRKGETVMVEFSSPNTNKPLHLGHIRNILLGWSCSQILDAAGYKVIKTQIVNDRGIAICRSMVGWLELGEGETPEQADLKGDHLVGKYYVAFAKAFQEEYLSWQETAEAQTLYQEKKGDDQSPKAFFKAFENQYFNTYSALGEKARAMLIRWEANDPEVRKLWETMNSWVYDGFKETYANLKVSFDKLYYESDTYLMGKELIQKGIEQGLFQVDGKRVWIDLEDKGLNRKTIIKSDGTSTYTSQDIGTAHVRYTDYGFDQMVYVVGDEQNNHFDVLFEILKQLEEPYADGLHHLSYGMVDLPSGKMKSREGTVVDADDLMAEVVEQARKNGEERGELDGMTDAEKEVVYWMVGLAALKFYIIKVNPQKRMTFNPAESVELQGQTGPYVQYSAVRIKGVLRKANFDPSVPLQLNDLPVIAPLEKEMLNQLFAYPEVVQAAASALDPSLVANYCFELAKGFNKFWHEHPILQAPEKSTQEFRLALSAVVGQVLGSGMQLLGIELPNKM